MLETCYEYINVSKKNFDVGNYDLAYRQASRCQDQVEDLFNVSNAEVQVKLLEILYHSAKIKFDGSKLLCCEDCSLRELKAKMLEYKKISEQDAYEPITREAARHYRMKLERDLKS